MSEEAVKYFLYRSKEELTNAVKKLTPRITSELYDAWTPKLSKTELRLRNSKEYSIFVEEGTGEYGPKKRRITPRGDKPMHANIGGEEIFFWSSKGRKAKHMARDGKKAYEAKIPRLAAEAFARTSK